MSLARNQRLAGMPAVDRVDDFLARGDDLFDAVARLELDVLDQREQQQVRHGHGQYVLSDGNGDAVALQRHLFRDQRDGCPVGRMIGKVDVREPELIRERLRNRAFGRQVHPDENGREALA